jgi:hypothetical protein
MNDAITNALDWCCHRCGGTAVVHFYGRDGSGHQRWQNRCQSCGRISEYLPTQREIEQQCRRLRASQGRLELDDEQEKLQRRLAAPDDDPDLY